MGSLLRRLVVGAVVLAALFGAALALAWILLPREWISLEARRQVARVSGASITWTSLEPGVEGLSLGVRIRGLAARLPAEGPPRAKVRAKEVFVRFRLLPLLLRRVEVAAARIRDAGVAFTEPAPGAATPEGAAPGASRAAQASVAFVLPTLELERIDVRSRDGYGAGFDLRSVRGKLATEGSLDRLRSLRLEAEAESLLWKPSAREALVPLPAPLRADAALEAEKGSKRLVVRRGKIALGPFVSTIEGTVEPDNAGTPVLALLLRGEPQSIRSADEALRLIAARAPATWEARASWEIRLQGPSRALVQSGRAAIEPLRVEAGSNRFALEKCAAAWTVSPDRRFTLDATGEGSGVAIELEAKGVAAPDGVTRGNFLVRGPAERLNGLLPDAPAWTEGRLEARAVFVLPAKPAPPEIQWTLRGEGLNGDISGLPRPVTGLRFDIAGDTHRADIRSLRATVGSSTADVRGSLTQGKPLGSGRLTIALDRFVAEEWTPPPGAKGGSAGRGPAKVASVPPVPLQSIDAEVTVGELRSQGLTVRDVVVPVRYREGTLFLEPIQGAIGSGTLRGSLRVDDLLVAPRYALRLDLDRAPAQDLVAGLLPFVRGFTGLVNGSLELEGPGLPGREVGESLRGRLSGRLEEGTIAAGRPVAALREALGLKADTDLAFRTLRHAIRIERGRLLVEELKGDVGLDHLEMGGSAGFDQSLDLRLLVRLAPERVEGGGTLAQIARLARDPDGRVPIEITIGGTVTAPRVAWKPGRVAAKAGERIARDLLQGLAETARSDSADSVKRDPVEKGREALRRLLGR